MRKSKAKGRKTYKVFYLEFEEGSDVGKKVSKKFNQGIAEARVFANKCNRERTLLSFVNGKGTPMTL